ncbi:MAG: hypothetical protein LBG96_14745 [Tannerella sp.]|nr:hypothetical protein [Tannerella sp.]
MKIKNFCKDNKYIRYIKINLTVDYSEKALAVFGDTRSVKDQLKALGGRFNPKLSHEGEKKAGWIFSKTKENDLRDLLTVK